MIEGRQIEVDFDAEHVGSLFFLPKKSGEAQSFVYSSEWLASKRRFQIDPELPLLPGRAYPARESFGFVQDASPDRWGRALMEREFRAKRSLRTSDYLLGVSDILRPGALRFREKNEYLATPRRGVPKIKNLHELSEKIRRYQEFCEKDDDLADLMDPGSSLGGSRPKLGLVDNDGKTFFIAKFPSLKDEIDVPLWEKVSLDLAAQCGLNVSPSRLIPVQRNRHALLIERFDRNSIGRIHFASAMTFLGACDGEHKHGYLHIAELIQDISFAPEADLREIWKRMLFNILTANRDDHLRNHGFLYDHNGWRLSPVYDLESCADKETHSLILDDAETRIPDPQIAIATSEYYGIKQWEALSELEAMQEVISQWRHVAEKYGATAIDMAHMEACYFD